MEIRVRDKFWIVLPKLSQVLPMHLIFSAIGVKTTTKHFSWHLCYVLYDVSKFLWRMGFSHKGVKYSEQFQILIFNKGLITQCDIIAKTGRHQSPTIMMFLYWRNLKFLIFNLKTLRQTKKIKYTEIIFLIHLISVGI